MKLKKYWFFGLILILVLISYGQTLGMYFWIDDNALIYKLQHINQNIGYWGTGIFGSGPYRHIIDQFIPFYPFFKVNPTPYYAVGILLYFLASLSVYYFTKALTKNDFTAKIASFIFASGYVGSETMFGITNSWQTARGIIMSLITFYFYLRLTRTKKPTFYILSLVMFFLSLETVYIRAHGLIFALIVFDILFWPVVKKLSSIAGLIARMAPFAFIYWKIYLYVGKSSFNGFTALNLFNWVFEDKKYDLLLIPLQDIGNLFIPDKLTFTSLGSVISGVTFLFLVVFLVKKYWRKKRKIVLTLIFSVAWMIFNFIIFYAREATHGIWTTHRYFTYSFVGLALFWATVFSLVEKNLGKNLAVVVIFIYLFLGVKKQYDFNVKRSIPARNFYATFKKELPAIPKGAYLYFDIKNDINKTTEYSSFFGGMFTAASNFAIYTEGVDYMKPDFLYTDNFDKVLAALKDGSLKLSNLYTFYYGDEGLINTSRKTRDLLDKGGSVTIPATEFVLPKNIVDMEVSPGASSLTPATLSFYLKAEIVPPVLPYRKGEMEESIDSAKKRKIYNYLVSKLDYYANSRSDSLSIWKEQKADLAIDSRIDTAWRANRGVWNNIQRGADKSVEFLQVDMGTTKNISLIRWVTSQKSLVPVSYKLFVSTDLGSWRKVVEVERTETYPEGTTLEDTFDPVMARYVKMEITKTYGNDGPEIKEFEVVEDEFADLSVKEIEMVAKDPFSDIKTSEEMNLALSYLRRNARVRVYWMSDADSAQDPRKYIELPLVLDGKYHEYAISLPAEGITWKKFSLSGFNFPGRGEIINPRVRYHTAN